MKPISKYKNNIHGFTLLELFVTVLIIAILLTIAISPLLTFISHHRLDQNAISVEQILQEARNYAITKSRDVEVIFSADGVTAQTSTGTILNEFQFENRIQYLSDRSTLNNDTIKFNFRGSPFLGSDEITDYTDTDGKIVLCFMDSSEQNCTYSKSIKVEPLTGVVVEQN